MEERLSPIGRFVVVKEAVFDNNSEMGKEENVINCDLFKYNLSQYVNSIPLKVFK